VSATFSGSRSRARWLLTLFPALMQARHCLLPFSRTIVFSGVNSMEFDGHDIIGLAKEIAEVLTEPLSTIIPLVQAIWNGLAFLGQGLNAPHWTYNVDAAVRYLVGSGRELRAAAA
jgi:hypothetical protein